MKSVALCLLALLCFTVATYGENPYFYGGQFDPFDQFANALANESAQAEVALSLPSTR